jgi:PAS domain S-box-containing protein
MTPRVPDYNLQFLSGGGEMGTLTREHDWTKTSLGEPAVWPQSLRTTLSALLNSKFPMFLFWGPELISFYNDAFRPSLGNNGKHPSILGEKGMIVWAEIWEQVSPLINQVMLGGDAIWNEDQLIPIFRNGRIEDVYWTYSYSPLNDESGDVAGVLVICSETTEKVKMVAEMKEREDQLNFTITAAELGTWDLNPHTNRFTGNERLKEWFGLQSTDEIDLSTAVNNVAERDRQKVTDAINKALQPGSDGNYDISYTIINPLTRRERNVLAKGKAVFDENGNPVRFSGTLQDISEQAIARKKIEESSERMRMLVESAPFPIGVYTGREMRIELANQAIMDIWGKGNDVHGKRYSEVLPELANQHIYEQLDNVFTTGVPFHAKNQQVDLVVDGQLQPFYFNYSFTPLYDLSGNIYAVMNTAADVTDLAVTRKKIEDSENSYRDIAEKLNIVIDASGLGTWEWDLQTDTIQHSGKYLEIFGSDDARNSDHAKHLTHIHPDDKMIRDIALAKALKQGSLDYELRIIWDDGSVHWIETKGKVFYDGHKRPLKLVGTIRDITQEKNRQQELFENEQRFRLLADSMPQHIWTADTEGNLNYYNQSVFNYSGLTVEQLDTEGWLQIVHPDDREENIRLWTESIVSGNDFLFEHRFRRHDGEYRWQLSRAIPQKDRNGNIQMWVGTSTDIEDQKTFTAELERKVEERTKELTHLNESLKKSEERYHLMVEEVEDYAILYLNRGGIIENWNKGAEKIKGYTAEEIVGKSFSVFYPEQERKEHLPETLLQQAIDKGKAIHEGWRLRKDGSRFWASVAITAVHDAERNVIGFSKVTHDLTEKKAADDKLKLNAEQLEQKNRDLEKMNTELQSFAYVSSHDLQEPLRKIQAFASRILSKEMQTLSETGKDYFRRMQEAAARMQTLI